MEISSSSSEMSPARKKEGHRLLASETWARPDMTDFEHQVKERVRPLIELNDRINSLTAQERSINSTRIVVAGDQSHGKTSLLEALSGVDLPRGEGIQTRVPAILQLREADGHDEYATIKIASSSGSAEKISLDQISEKVQEYTEKAAGEGKDVRDEPIELKIFRRDQDNLTLIDLPGITRVALSDQAGGDGKKLETLILGMCRRYMSPKQSILLNVVSAMVDFSTSASLQLSRDLDPEGERTLLCVTKVDQHQEKGLDKKIMNAMNTMSIAPQHIFAVINRSQEENDNKLPLSEARRREMEKLDSFSGGDVEYGLGVAALSKQLVNIQYSNILRSIPEVHSSIEDLHHDLQGQLEELGDALVDTLTCRSKAIQFIDLFVGNMQSEITGQRTDPVEDNCKGKSVEVSVRVNNFPQTRRDKKNEEKFHLDGESSIGSYTFSLQVYPYETKEQDTTDDKSTVGAYLHVKAPSHIQVESMTIDCELYATSGGEVIQQKSFVRDFAANIKSGTARGLPEFLSAKQSSKIQGEVTFHASAYVSDLSFSSDEACTSCSLLCALLADIEDDFVADIGSIYSNYYFFSDAFRKDLSQEVKLTRGGTGLPGAIAPHVPVSVLNKLRQKLPITIERYRQRVMEAVEDSFEANISACISKKLHPRFHGLILDQTGDISNDHLTSLAQDHKKLIDWETTMKTSNHYFMDTVQSIRDSIFNSDSDKKPYLKDLNANKIKAMSNTDQRLVDMQIELFSFWKLMKKRVIDNVIMSTYFELVSKPIHQMLKVVLTEKALSYTDNDLVSLLSPNDSIVQKRADLVARLERLKEAEEALSAYVE